MISQGFCSSVTLLQTFKVCCPSSQFYNIYTKSCGSSNGNNCDQTNKICCPNSQKLEYISLTNQFICVNNCNWAGITGSGLYCELKYCNTNLVIIQSSPSLLEVYNSSAFNQSNRLLIAYSNGKCCYGVSNASDCYTDKTDCGQRFINRGWGICCPSAYYYNFTTKSCLLTCNGYILFNFLCITNNSFLDLAGNPGDSPNETSNAFCNNNLLPSDQPYCCPPSFYVAGNDGCELCVGKIYKAGAYQTCCPQNYYYDPNQGCLKCIGHLDQSGTICCFPNQFI